MENAEILTSDVLKNLLLFVPQTERISEKSCIASVKPIILASKNNKKVSSVGATATYPKSTNKVKGAMKHT